MRLRQARPYGSLNESFVDDSREGVIMTTSTSDTTATLQRALLAALLTPAARAGLADLLAQLDRARDALAQLGIATETTAAPLALPPGPAAAAAPEPAATPPPGGAVQTSAPCGRRAARREAPVREAKPQAKAAPAPAASAARRCAAADQGGCRGALEQLRCAESGCTWTAWRCAAHRAAGRGKMAIAGHVRCVHKGQRPPSRWEGHEAKTPAKASPKAKPAKEPVPAPALDLAKLRRDLIAARVAAVGPKPAAPPSPGAKPTRGRRTIRCSVCQSLGHNARACPRRRTEDAAIAGDIHGHGDLGDVAAPPTADELEDLADLVEGGA